MQKVGFNSVELTLNPVVQPLLDRGSTMSRRGIPTEALIDLRRRLDQLPLSGAENFFWSNRR